jgi:hypothetical protein
MRSPPTTFADPTQTSWAVQRYTKECDNTQRRALHVRNTTGTLTTSRRAPDSNPTIGNLL